MPKITTAARLKEKRKKYEQDYDLSSINSSNDEANLNALLNYQLIIEDLQEELNNLMDKGAADNILQIKKLGDAAKDALDRAIVLEKQLGIDRKTRKTEISSESPAEYIKSLKLMAKNFLEQRMIKVYCTDCNVMVMRFFPVHEHTKFDVKCQCSQCKKIIRVHREEKDVLFDLPTKERKWREKYPIEVIQSKKEEDDIDEEDDVIIGGE